jgi:uncharacterized membrane protein affecting hemolysin expression
MLMAQKCRCLDAFDRVMCGYAKISGDTRILATSQARLFNPTQQVAWV